MRSDYLDRLADYIALKSDNCYKGNNTKYLSFDNLSTPEIIFSYRVYQDKKGTTYSANLYYWYYLLLTLL